MTLPRRGGEIDLEAARKEQAKVDLANRVLDAEDFFGSSIQYIVADGSFTFEIEPLVSADDEAHVAAMAKYRREFKELIQAIGEVPDDYQPPSVNDPATDVEHVIVGGGMEENN